ncbi:PAS domain-containing protein [Halobacteriovorax sp. JY17]|uniref:PAS domain-containing protein n=1 Tax=Halobacteriovorax sp. JY17 TaxID=2014617 RepID=UPI000C5D9FFF|nr:PAS domain-containing protein [Halobacteriovorax sp. JY17]PIK13882.1 MAG: hypothetical protein CES88_12920 [Halobacteriovorax sp. JY17]
MNLSLKNRVAASFIIACFVVLVVGFTVFFHLNSLNKEIESITVKSNRVSLLTDEIRISAVSILKYQRRILSKKASPELVEKLVNLCDSFTSQLQTLDSLYRDPDVKRVVAQMQSYVDSLKVVLGKASLFHRDNIGMASIGDLADKILDSFSEFQDIQYFQSVERDKKIKKIINETKRNMMITLIISFLGTIILGLVVPGKIALPFKKIKDAIRELQDCNFDVSIYYSQDDEIGEIAREMNKMIHSFKVFEELRTDRISLENRKFDALANLVKKPVLLANANNQIIYMNSRLYSLLQVQSEDVIGKTMSDTLIPESIISTYQLAIKRRSKIENADIVIPKKKLKEVEAEGESSAVVEDDSAKLENGEAEVEENIFSGYGNVIPIRGKESSMDYYLMVLSTDVHV